MNTTPVNGSSCSSVLNPTAEIIGKTFAYSLIFVVSLVGNSLIALVVYNTQSMRKPINYFFVNIAISDLMFSILLPLELTNLYLDSWLISGPFGHALCKICIFLPQVSSGVSIQSLVLIAVDRFGAVIFPLRSPLISSKLCPFFILATWIIAMATFSPFLLSLKLVHYAGQPACLLRWSETFGDNSSFLTFVLATQVIFFYISVTFLIMIYSTILMKLKLQKIPGEQSANAQQQRAKRNRNVLSMAIAIVLGFVLCWIPHSIIMFLKTFGDDSSWNCGTRYVGYSVVTIMLLSNCAVNPCICFTFSGNYRQELKRLLYCFQ